MSSIADSSFDVHPNTKGSYRRRAEDITRAPQRLRVEDLSSAVAFLIYYFACEKLAKIIIGISNKKPASKYFDKNYSLHINNISSSCKKIGFSITDEDINWIFVSRCDNEKWRSFLRSHHQNSPSSNYTKSARWLRNKMVHDTHIERDLALVKVTGRGNKRVESLRIADIFRANVVDSSHEHFVFEVTGKSDKLDVFIDLMKPLGLVDVSRTGVVAISQSSL